MAYELPIECPICHDVLEPDRTLEHHLLRTHSHLDLARYVASTQERVAVSADVTSN